MKHIFKLILLVAIVSCSSCKKFLDEKPDASLAIPNSLGDLQALLDAGGLNVGMRLNNIGTDEFYITNLLWGALPISNINKSAYVWNSKTAEDPNDWKALYKAILHANTVLDNVDKVEIDEEKNINRSHVKGAAFFYRARCFYDLAQVYSTPYFTNSALNELGIPLRLNSDFNIPSSRSSVQKTYDQIVQDLKSASTLLPNLPLYKTRPSKASAFALLARTYLTIGQFEKAKENAEACLNINSSLIDYNSLDSNRAYPFTRYNDEVIFSVEIDAINSYPFPYVGVDTGHIKLYETNDLRRVIFFNKNPDNSFTFKGSYAGGTTLFNGLTTSEVYLILAESNVRLGKISEALLNLNILLKKRWKQGTFNPVAITDKNELLKFIIMQRKIELINRGLRWSDIRRYQNEPNFQVTLNRVINGESFSLPPNDLRHTWLIPFEIVNVSGIEQNKR